MYSYPSFRWLSSACLVGAAAAPGAGGGGLDPAAEVQLHGGGNQVPALQAQRRSPEGPISLC
jgi:hypothetical protein